MYRDLKPDNIGFDVRGDVKIFDFGLAKEFDPDKSENGFYQLTGDTGSPRYVMSAYLVMHNVARLCQHCIFTSFV
jgi:serine/threonine protein kinase